LGKKKKKQGLQNTTWEKSGEGDCENNQGLNARPWFDRRAKQRWIAGKGGNLGDEVRGAAKIWGASGGKKNSSLKPLEGKSGEHKRIKRSSRGGKGNKERGWA